MAGSYSKINYRLRPAKAIERKIICDFVRCLAPFGEVRNYRYIGFGSTYFSDFILFHKVLHMEDMISIEKDGHARERFEYNKPFQCIQMKYGSSSEVLSSLNWNNPKWNKRSVVWLDYDSPLENSTLDDIDFLASNLVSGSLLIVTVSAEPERPSKEGLTLEEINRYRRENLLKRISGKKIPAGVKSVDLTGKNLANLYKRIIKNQLAQSLRNAKAARSEKKQNCYKQIFDFRYSDGARMLTLGWLIYEQNDYEKAEACKFDQCFNVIAEDKSLVVATAGLVVSSENTSVANELITEAEKGVAITDEPIVTTNVSIAMPPGGVNEGTSLEDVFYEINVPNLTIKEIQYLDSKMPTTDYKIIERLCIPLQDIKHYAELYKYFPSFVEMIM